MANYQHLTGKGFQEGATGPRILQTNVTTKLTANQDEYDIEQKSSIERHYPVGVYVTDPDTKTTPLLTVAALAVFNSAYINFRVGTTNVIKKLYFSTIKKYNDQGKPFPLEFGQRVNLSESKIYVNDSAAIAANTCLELNFDFVKKAK